MLVQAVAAQALTTELRLALVEVVEDLISLETLVQAMEEGELSLEESLKAFEQGIKLTRECQSALEQAEQKVQMLVQDGQVPVAAPYEDEDDADSAP